jgi:hypothetical protein
MMCFSQIVNFENWEILAFQLFQTILKPTTLRKQTFLKINFPFYPIDFLKRNFKSDAILICFQGRFPKKLSWKVNSQKRHYIKKRIFKYSFCCHIWICLFVNGFMSNWQWMFYNSKKQSFEQSVKFRVSVDVSGSSRKQSTPQYPERILYKYEYYKYFSTITQWVFNFFAFWFLIWACILVGHISQKKSSCQIQDGVWGSIRPICQYLAGIPLAGRQILTHK